MLAILEFYIILRSSRLCNLWREKDNKFSSAYLPPIMISFVDEK